MSLKSKLYSLCSALNIHPYHSILSLLVHFDADGNAVEVSANNRLPVEATISLDGTTIELGATSLAALETIELGATSLAALESITADLKSNSIYYLSGAASKAEIKAAAGSVKKIWGENKTQETRYIQIFNALPADVTLGTTPPTYVIPIAAAGFFEFDLNIAHSNAISYAVTDTETGLTTAALSTLNIAYQ